MTFNFAPWAIDGARSRAGLARLASYASSGGRSGIIKPADLRVTALSVPGNGLRIAAGGAVVLNHYLNDPDEAYVLSNPATHTVLAADMPSPQPATSYYLVCAVVGDPEFDQTGHPFMPSSPLDPATAADFEYVRVVVVPCPAGTTSFEQLGYNYPAYALARLEVPANTSTITNAMIVDLRTLTKPRESSKLIVSQPVPQGTETWFDSASWTDFGDTLVEIPVWATRMSIYARMDSIVHFDPAVVGAMRIRVGATAGGGSMYELPDTSGAGERIGLAAVWDADISALAGTSQVVSLQVYRESGAGWLIAYYDALVSIDVRFSERPV